MISPPALHLLWLYDGMLSESLDAATWLETTRELRSLGWHVTLVVAGPSGKNNIHGVEVYSIPFPDIYLIRKAVYHLFFLSLLFLKWRKVDVILFHPISAIWFIPYYLFCKLFKSRRPLLVMDIRSMHMPQLEKQKFKDKLRDMYQRFIIQRAYLWTDGYLAITKRMAEALEVPPQHLLGVWPSGVDFALFNSAQKKRNWPGAGGPITLIYVGALHYERNLMSLCKAVEMADAEGMAFKLILIGDGDERKALEEFAETTSGRVCVLQPVPHNQVPDILADAHIGVLPFPDEEKYRVSSPIKLFEYMAAGLPILATRVVCHTDVIGDGDYVFWAEQSDVSGLLEALCLAWSKCEDLPEMGAKAALASQAWTWRESALKIQAALESGLQANHWLIPIRE